MNYKNSAKVCLYNYFRDFGYEEDINKLDEIVILDDCDNPLEFVKKLESIKLKATITAFSLSDFDKDKYVPFFAICEIERGKTIYLPVYKIDNDFIILKDSKGKTIRIKLSLFSQIYQGKIIEITNNKKFLKENFLKEEHKKLVLFGIPAAIFIILFLTSIVFLLIATTSKSNPFADEFSIAIYIAVFTSLILSTIFVPLFCVHHKKFLDTRKGRNRSYDDGLYYRYVDDGLNQREAPSTLDDIAELIYIHFF